MSAAVASPARHALAPGIADELARLRLLLRRRALWLRSAPHAAARPAYGGLVIGDEEADRLLDDRAAGDERRFVREDPAAIALSRELDELNARAAARRETLGASPLDAIAELLGLDPIARGALVLALAPRLDPGIARVYAYVQDDATRACATPELAAALYGNGDPAAAGTWLLAGAPLRRYALMTVEDGAMRLDDGVAARLLGAEAPDPALAAVLERVAPPPLAANHHRVVDSLADWIRTLDAWPLIALAGDTGAAAAVASGACARLGLDLRAIRRPLDVAPAELRPLVDREAALAGLALYVAPDAPDEAVGLADAVEAPVFAAAETWAGARAAAVVRLPDVDPPGQRTLWRRALAPCALADEELERVVQQFDMQPAALARAAASARRRARQVDGGEVRFETLWEACREECGGGLDGLAERVEQHHGWDDLVLPESALVQLRELATQPLHRTQVYERWGFGAKLGRGRGIAALFSGPTGTGKTMAAEVVARELKLDLYRVDLAGVVSKYIGETEKNLARVFGAAERSGAVLLFDEADALFGRRTAVKDSHDRYANIEVNYLLQRMEEYPGLAILATNRSGAIDRAFLRRMRFAVEFPFPDAASRRLIWRAVLPPQAPLDGVDLDELARLEIAGGNIRSIAVNAAFLAAEAGTPIRMPHLLLAARREYAKIDRLLERRELALAEATA